MKKKIGLIFVILLFVVGIGIMSYPMISAMINNHALAQESRVYYNTVKNMDNKRYRELLSQAKSYNESLTDNVIITDPFDEEAYRKIGANYEKTLDVDGKGLIGYVEIPKISVNLPIYHGTSEKILQKGAGHLQNTSLPIGGKSTHSVISAHTGMPTATMFDYLTEMKKGDAFYIRVIGKTLKYQVDQIKVVLPEKTQDLHIVKGEDHITLLTCTPYGLNTHRLLVRGVRVPMDKSDDEQTVQQATFRDGYMYLFGYRIPYWVVTIVIVGFVILVATIVFAVVRKNKKKLQTSVDINGSE
ncbi:MAG: class C sortase [Oscillospiraceae bacterium]|nr:class C sortase [Oscillospiraceae bacterium]